ncbi:MAG: alpha amylase C-terminal domain-containing protein, partial [Chloroflexota bacterium]|nr:alpha amylase C-terminal domain-containing protein [Chloroflexota bacterium]
SVISFIRRAVNPEELIVVVGNFTPQPRLGYRIGLPTDQTYYELLNSDATRYGGSGIANQDAMRGEARPWQNCAYSATINLPPLAVIMLKPVL